MRPQRQDRLHPTNPNNLLLPTPVVSGHAIPPHENSQGVCKVIIMVTSSPPEVVMGGGEVVRGSPPKLSGFRVRPKLSGDNFLGVRQLNVLDYLEPPGTSSPVSASPQLNSVFVILATTGNLLVTPQGSNCVLCLCRNKGARRHVAHNAGEMCAQLKKNTDNVGSKEARTPGAQKCIPKNQTIVLHIGWDGGQ